MIKVLLKQEPDCFNAKVREPGAKFLQKIPNPNYQQFNNHSYWLKILPDISTAYGNICAYTGCKMHSDATIDHFRPKCKYPHLSYEWSNYRLCMNKLNQYKHKCDDILDPFEIEDGWFQIDFPSCLVVADRCLSLKEINKIEYTINKLHLNDNQLVGFRCAIVIEYINDRLKFDCLQKIYPFVANEISRQGLILSVGKFFPGINSDV